MHAYHHANTKSAWKDFSNISPVYLEFLAQLFTFLCVKGTNLESYFRNLSSHQSTIYQTWILAQDFSSSNAYKIYKEIFKNGATSKFGLDLFAQKYLEKASEDLKENKGLPKIIKTSDDLLQLERTLVCSIENLKKIIFITGILLKEVKF